MKNKVTQVLFEKKNDLNFRFIIKQLVLNNGIIQLYVNIKFSLTDQLPKYNKLFIY